MLKWTASAQKLAQTTTPNVSGTTTTTRQARRQRRATISGNKENIPFTSTPMITRQRNSPLVLAATPIIAVDDSPVMQKHTPRRHVITGRSTVTSHLRQRRHSTVGFSIPLVPPVSTYASTLPRFEEEYSPSAAVLPSGQQLALRGLLPQPFLGYARYFNTPEVQKAQKKTETLPSVPQPKRKLEQEFELLAEESACPGTASRTRNVSSNCLSSEKMGDQTLDKLIDAILDSARKDVKKKKSRKSFNLRRRTLLKQQSHRPPECGGGTVSDLVLSPSYAAGDDPASDLSFLLSEPLRISPTARCEHFALPTTPAPATPLPGTPIPTAVLRQLPTPAPFKCDTFAMDTPVRRPPQKRRKAMENELQSTNTVKKCKVEPRNYFEVGLALPSVYV